MEVEPPHPPAASKLDAMDTADDDATTTTTAVTHHATTPSESEGDLYTRLKTLQRQLEFYEIQVRECVCLCVGQKREEEGRERIEKEEGER